MSGIRSTPNKLLDAFSELPEGVTDDAAMVVIKRHNPNLKPKVEEVYLSYARLVTHRNVHRHQAQVRLWAEREIASGRTHKRLFEMMRWACAYVRDRGIKELEALNKRPRGRPRK